MAIPLNTSEKRKEKRMDAARLPRLVGECLVNVPLRNALENYVCTAARRHSLFRENGRKLYLCNKAKLCPKPGCDWHPKHFSGDVNSISTRQLRCHIEQCFRHHYQIGRVEFAAQAESDAASERRRPRRRRTSTSCHQKSRPHYKLFCTST
jgi:hypothetical protein